MKPRWDRKPCGCVKANLPRSGRVLIRCTRHRQLPPKSKRVLCYFEDGLVRKEAA